MKRKRKLLNAALALLALPLVYQAAASAQPVPAPTPDVRTFVVTAARPPVPALTYRFDFMRQDQYDGNGGATFLQALMVRADEKFTKDLKALEDVPNDDDFVAAARQQLPFLDTKVPPLLASAVRYHTCTFDWPVREDGINTLLPYLSQVRTLANLVQAKTRLATATGDWPQSIELIRAMAVLADRVDDGDTFIVNNLVSVGVGDMCVREIQRLLERPESPNLFWAMRQFAVPFGNLRRAARNEASTWEMTFADLREARRGVELSAAQWQRVTDGVVKTFPEVKQLLQLDDPPLLAAARADYARRYDRPAADVEKREAAHVIAAHVYATYRDAADDVLKWGDLPYPQALPGATAATTRMKDEMGASQPGNLVLRMGQTGLLNGLIANARLDRGIAATATVEALRAYAADHDGHWPAALADITDTPPPDNPVTGRPFDYAVEGDTAVISDPGQWIDKPLRYEVRLRK